ncbi:MAG: hypothetical protein WBM24_07945 [Candidatus Sulfotelmatobacter sp.]
MLLAPLAALAADSMTHEETVVRTAYAKFAYAVQQEAISQLALEADHPEMQRIAPDTVGQTVEQRLANAQVTFTLTDFTIGDIRDILSRKAVDFISPAVGESLDTMNISYNYSEVPGVGSVLQWLHPQWKPAIAVPGPIAELDLKTLYQMQWEKDDAGTLWQRYASYSVTVAYRGKSRGPSKAMFIFGRDPKGNEVIEPEDGTTDPSGLVQAMHVQLFPDALVSTRLRKVLVVTDWLAAHQMTSPTCSVGQRDVCCDLAKLQCGPGATDVAQGLLKQLPTGKGN